MKSCRVWLLLLLAVLLPLRGALAAGMLCPVAEFGVQAEARLASHAHGHDHAAAHPDGAAHEHAGAADKCKLCSAFCSVTGLVGADLSVAVSQPGSAVFSQPHAPPPSFVPDGQERPPRTI